MKNMAIASLVLGIVGIVGSFIPFVNFVAGIAPIVGLVLAIISRKRLKEAGEPTGIATAGMILAIVSLAFAIIMVACVVCATAALLM